MESDNEQAEEATGPSGDAENPVGPEKIKENIAESEPEFGLPVDKEKVEVDDIFPTSDTDIHGESAHTEVIENSQNVIEPESYNEALQESEIPSDNSENVNPGPSKENPEELKIDLESDNEQAEEATGPSGDAENPVGPEKIKENIAESEPEFGLPVDKEKVEVDDIFPTSDTDIHGESAHTEVIENSPNVIDPESYNEALQESEIPSENSENVNPGPSKENPEELKIDLESDNEQAEEANSNDAGTDHNDDDDPYKDGSICAYCNYCKLCTMCRKCPSCRIDITGDHCEMCKYCKYCKLCDYFCVTICNPGSFLDTFTGAIYAVLPRFSKKTKEEVNADIGKSKDIIKEYL